MIHYTRLKSYRSFLNWNWIRLCYFGVLFFSGLQGRYATESYVAHLLRKATIICALGPIFPQRFNQFIRGHGWILPPETAASSVTWREPIIP